MQMPGAFSRLIMSCLFPSTSLSRWVGALSFELKTPYRHCHLILSNFAPISFLLIELSKMLFDCLLYMLIFEVINKGIELPRKALMLTAVPSTDPGQVSGTPLPTGPSHYTGWHSDTTEKAVYPLQGFKTSSKKEPQIT